VNEEIALFKRCVSDKYEVSIVLAHLFECASNTGRRKLRGQYFTPRSIAQFAVKLLMTNGRGILVDAGCGTGIFAAETLRRSKQGPGRVRYLGVEIDPMLALCTAVTLDVIGAPDSWKVLMGNYLSLDQEYLSKMGFSGVSQIVSNPPYVRFHRIKDKRKLIAVMKKRTGIRLSGFSGMHSFFLAQSSALIDANGIMVFVLPPEVGLINHSSSVLDQLSVRYDLRKFPRMEDLTVIRLQARRKNTPRFEPSPSNVVRVHLMEIANVHRGISTGANSFFALTDQMVQNWDIPEGWRTRIIPTKISLPEEVFRERDWNKLREEGKPCWLLRIPRESAFERLPESIKNYISIGEGDRINLRPTCKFRDRWYCVPVLPAPDMIFTYISHERPRFIYNQARAHILTNLLGVVLKTRHQRGEIEMRNLSRLLTRDLVAWTKETGAGRRYAGGLTKFEPGDLKNMPLSSEVLAASNLR
jgi:hypothetical protein